MMQFAFLIGTHALTPRTSPLDIRNIKNIFYDHEHHILSIREREDDALHVRKTLSVTIQRTCSFA